MAKRMYGVNDNIFDNIDNQDKAYVLGLLYADGCNYYEKGCVKIDLIEDDLEILEKLKIFFEYEGDIKHHKQGMKKFSGKEYFCKDSCRLSISSRNISEKLAKYGCVANKSYIMTFPNKEIINEILLRHFIRGFMDGNGGISYWIDNLNTGHKKFQVNFCGTTDMINTISKILGNKFSCCPAISDRYEERDNNNLQVNICGNRVVEKILDWLYLDANIYMQRKYNKYLELKDEIKRVDGDKNLYGSAKPRRPVIRLLDKEIYESVAMACKMNDCQKYKIYSSCQRKKDFMYLDEYEKGEL